MNFEIVNEQQVLNPNMLTSQRFDLCYGHEVHFERYKPNETHELQSKMFANWFN